jgi:hypothetical protein
MSYFRDDELGRTLQELEVPEHRTGFDDELIGRLTEVLPRRRFWLPAAAVALALPLAAAIVLLAPSGSDVASAADLRERVIGAVESAPGISGVFVNREQPRSGRENRWQFVLDDSGSFRIAGLEHQTVLSYDAGTNVESSSDGDLFVTRTGLAPGPPDAEPAGWVAQRGLGSVVAALAASEDSEVVETEHRGRPGWQVRVPTGNPGEERVIVVDRETGIPVRSALFRNGTAASEWLIEDLRVEPPGDVQFAPTPAPNQERRRYDMGFRRVRLEAIPARVAYRPLVPAWVPSRFELAEVAVAQRSRPTGDEQRPNPPSQDVVSLRYRRGLDELVVTTRRTGGDPAAWGDPVIGSAPMGRAPERVVFEDGVLAGVRGEVVVDANSVPHAWAVAGPLVVTIAGNLDRDELVRVAESLRRAG